MKAKKLKNINIGNVGKLVIPQHIIDAINYLHRRYKSKEWSGVIFYKELKEIDDLKNLEFEVKYLYPMDLGSTAYTSFNYNEDVLKAYELFPESMELRRGLIHTHHTMTAFFSGTDIDELVENAPSFDMYLSLVVAEDYAYKAKVTFCAEAENIASYKLKNIDKLQNKVFKSTTKEEVALICDLDIVMPSQHVKLDWLDERIKELENKRSRIQTVQTTPSYYKESSLFPKDWNYHSTTKATAKQDEVENFLIHLISLDEDLHQSFEDDLEVYLDEISTVVAENGDLLITKEEFEIVCRNLLSQVYSIFTKKDFEDFKERAIATLERYRITHKELKQFLTDLIDVIKKQKYEY